MLPARPPCEEIRHITKGRKINYKRRGQHIIPVQLAGVWRTKALCCSGDRFILIQAQCDAGNSPVTTQSSFVCECNLNCVVNNTGMIFVTQFMFVNIIRSKSCVAVSISEDINLHVLNLYEEAHKSCVSPPPPTLNWHKLKIKTTCFSHRNRLKRQSFIP